jgi:RNA-binding protein YhbY
VRQIATDFRAEVVQEIGKVVLVYRRNPEPNPRLTKVPRSM